MQITRLRRKIEHDPEGPALPADRARLGLHAGAGLTGRCRGRIGRHALRRPRDRSARSGLPIRARRSAGATDRHCRDARADADRSDGLGGRRRLPRRPAAAARPGARRGARGERRGRAAGDRRLADAGQAPPPPRPDGRGAAHPRDRHARRLLDDLARPRAAARTAGSSPSRPSRSTPRSPAPTSPAPASPTASRCCVGPALDTLPTLEGRSTSSSSTPTSERTPTYLDWALRLSRPGTVIVCDNVVRDGRVADAVSRQPAARRHPRASSTASAPSRG